MSSTEGYNPSPESLAKGKGRADDLTEQTPLLPSTSTQSSSSYVESLHTAPNSGRQTLRAKLTFVFVASLSFCITAFLVIGLLAWSYASKAYNVLPEEIVKDAVVFRGPDRIDVLNVSSSGEIWLSVDVKVGVDVGSVIGVGRDAEEAGLMVNAWKALGRWGVRRLDRISVNLSTIDIISRHEPSIVLASIVVQALEVPLTPDPPHDFSWLTDVSTTVLVRPTSNTSALVEFLRDSWGQGAVDVHVDVGRASIRGGNLDEESWRSLIHKVFYNIRTSIKLPS